MRCLYILVLGVVALRAETIDRIAVSVGNQVITESAILLDCRLTAFLDRIPVATDGETKRKSAERLVDRILILEEADVSHLLLPTSDRGAALVQQVRMQYGSETEYNTALTRYGITEKELNTHLLAGLRLFTFVDLRFRPAVQVSDDDLHAYYEDLKKQNPAATAPPFEEARDEIERLLTDQKALDAMEEWLKSARTSAKPKYRDEVFQ